MTCLLNPHIMHSAAPYLTFSTPPTPERKRHAPAGGIVPASHSGIACWRGLYLKISRHHTEMRYRQHLHTNIMAAAVASIRFRYCLGVDMAVGMILG